MREKREKFFDNSRNFGVSRSEGEELNL